jgi:50S ribosomal subunit-associated GTPase HflX
LDTVPPIKVAIAGAPRVGKTTLLHSLAKHAPNSDFTTQAEETKRIVHLDILSSQLPIRFMAAQGPFVGFEEVIPAILTDARIVVFVIAASQGREQQGPFEQYASFASDIGVHWNDVPWIFVLNKVDLGKRNPLLADIPAQFRNDIVQCVAREDKGIEQLWQQIIKTVSSLG